MGTSPEEWVSIKKVSNIKSNRTLSSGEKSAGKKKEWSSKNLSNYAAAAPWTPRLEYQGLQRLSNWVTSFAAKGITASHFNSWSIAGWQWRSSSSPVWPQPHGAGWHSLVGHWLWQGRLPRSLHQGHWDQGLDWQGHHHLPLRSTRKHRNHQNFQNQSWLLPLDQNVLWLDTFRILSLVGEVFWVLLEQWQSQSEKEIFHVLIIQKIEFLRIKKNISRMVKLPPLHPFNKVFYSIFQLMTNSALKILNLVFEKDNFDISFSAHLCLS